MRTQANEFGMSDIGLARICRKHDTPVPPVGYWQRKETGQNINRPVLRLLKTGSDTFDIRVRERPRPELVALTLLNCSSKNVQA
jgi:hypothetical protein